MKERRKKMEILSDVSRLCWINYQWFSGKSASLDKLEMMV